MDIDVLGSYNTLKATVPYLLESSERHKPATPSHSATRSSSPTGRIIFISATIHYTGLPLQSHVAAAKAGIDALSASVGIEYGPRGLTSNIIAPGPIAGTEGMERLATAGGQEKAGKAVPVGRLGTVRDIADATVYLFSEAGGFVNGEILVGEFCSCLLIYRPSLRDRSCANEESVTQLTEAHGEWQAGILVANSHILISYFRVLKSRVSREARNPNCEVARRTTIGWHTRKVGRSRLRTKNVLHP